MLQLTPFLLFDGHCAEAMEFYRQCFGGDLTMTQLADTPMKTHFPAALHNRITYAHLKSSAVELCETDWLHSTHARQQGNSTAVFVHSEQPDELRSVFDKLAIGASEHFFVALSEMPFGIYGRMTDRFGIEWYFRS